MKNPVIHTISPPQKAAEKVWMATPTDSSDASQKVKTLMTSVNKPRVKIVIGSVSSTRSGRTIELIAESTNEKINASLKFSMVKPGIVCQIVITIKSVITKRKMSSIKELLSHNLKIKDI